MKKLKYERPGFLRDLCTRDIYECWLYRRTAAHIKRDQKRTGRRIKPEHYRMAIHKAVEQSKGIDAFTQQKLHWKLLSKYRNDEARKKGSKYKKKFALLPTVDHDHAENGEWVFRICSWRTNDSKSDLTLKEFKLLCRLVLQNA